MAKKRHKRIITGLALFWAIIFGLQWYNMQSRSFDEAVLRSNSHVSVTVTDSTIHFSPVADTTRTGFLFYPGALVDPEAYAPLARDVAEAGYEAVIIKLPYRLAPFESHHKQLFVRTRTIIKNNAAKKWVVGGHSKGGKLATLYVRRHAPTIDGLLLVGTSHPREIDLSTLQMDVTKVYGTEDRLASVEEIKRFAVNLPGHTRWVRIEGGNHRQFGWYGYQFGDGEARISRKRQHQLTTVAILRQLRRIASTAPPPTKKAPPPESSEVEVN